MSLGAAITPGGDSMLPSFAKLVKGECVIQVIHPLLIRLQFCVFWALFGCWTFDVVTSVSCGLVCLRLTASLNICSSSERTCARTDDRSIWGNTC